LARQIAGTLFNLSSTSALRVQSADSSERANDPELQALLQDPKKSEEVYPLLAPMLFPDGDCGNVGCLFQTQALMSVRHRIYFASVHITNLISVYQSSIVREGVNH
jgi:hypothetical protein